MSTGRRFLVMTAGGHAYALPLEQIAEVMDSCLLSPVPRAPVWCKGALQTGGTVVAVLDLAQYVGDEPLQQPEKIVVLDLRLGGLGLLVGRVEDVVMADGTTIEQDSHGDWLVTVAGRAELLDASELVQEVSAAMAS